MFIKSTKAKSVLESMDVQSVTENEIKMSVKTLFIYNKFSTIRIIGEY